MGAIGQHTVHTTDRLAKLRALMKDNSLGAFVVSSEDQHSSEYIAHCDERRAYISGFNGSAGCAIVTLEKAFLFTDGRYFLQAEKQLDENWTLMKQGLPDVPSWQEFLHKQLEPNSRIGIDPTLIEASDARDIEMNLKGKNSELVLLSNNLIDAIWTDRPARPCNKVFHLDEKYSGQSIQSKISKVREILQTESAKAVVVTMLDEVAWLFNLRGSDIDYNPVFFSYAVVTIDEAILFIADGQMTEDALQYLGNQVRIKPYNAFFDDLKELPSTLDLSDKSKIILGSNASLAVAAAIGEGKYTLESSPINELKAVKNDVELEGFRQCHVRDGIALARYFAWLEEQLDNGVELNESQGAAKLEKCRSELENFQGLSFTTISSTGPNGAIIHYSPDPNDCDIIRKDQIYLCDSGGQYLDGTTDVTRTWHFGTPADEEKRAFTRVLQGHISIDTAVFPSGTTGLIIDAFARRALWQDGLDYRHGTGHGVGHFLNVHEGPHGIGPRLGNNKAALKAGMTVSNEPGYYEDGRYGIRIENIVLVREVKTRNNFGNQGYLGFEHVTLCPMHKVLIDVNLLSQDEKRWVDSYHAEIWGKLSPYLANDPRALAWLKRETSPL